MRKWYTLIIAILFFLFNACTPSSQDDRLAPLAYCDLVANPSQYDGQVVRVSAINTVGFEWSYLSDEKCPNKTKTWIIIPRSSTFCDDATNVSVPPPPQHDRNESIERNVIISGKFHNSNIVVSATEYQFNMEFICLESAGEWRVVR